MKVIVSAEAAARLEHQVQYIRDQHAPQAAERLRLRVLSFVEKHISRFPGAGRKIDVNGRELREAWVPKTKLIVWYEIQADQVAIVSVWHAAQDRPAG